MNDQNIDSLKMYLDEIGSYPVLSKEEEQQLFNRILENDEKAKELFIKSNLRLVASIASRYQNRGVSLLDLIQEGNCGLLRAVDKFDITKGYKFSSYATYWIKNFMQRAIINQANSVRLPVYKNEQMINFFAAIEQLRSQLHREPTNEEIAKQMNVSVEQVEEFQNYTNYNSSISGDEFMEEYGYDIFTTETSDTLLDHILIEDRLETIKKVLDSAHLTQIEKEVILLHNGFEGSTLTFEEIGKKFNLTRERIRQIETNALWKIRKCPMIEHLLDYVDNPIQAEETISLYQKHFVGKRNHKNYIQ